MSTQTSTASDVAKSAAKSAAKWGLKWVTKQGVKRATQAAVAAVGWEVILILLLVALLLLIPILAVLGVGLLSIFTTEPPGPPGGMTGQIAGVKYADIINEAAAQYGVDPALIAAVIRQESDFDPEAGSHKGAQGLMQVMPFNAKGADLRDPRENIFRGTEILASHIQKYDGDLEKALAAYNAGPGAVSKYNGIPPFKETQAYVPRVLKYYKQYQPLVKNGQIVATLGHGMLALPAETKVSCGFNCYKNHGGIDFSGRGNRAIYAAESGRVVRKEDRDGQSYGTLVVIDHGGGIETAYAHMYWKDIQVETGQMVQRGQRIGTMGNNGNSSGTHLHFEVRQDGKRVDPTPYLADK
ncbi:putative peptidase, peptidase M23 family protein [Mycobacterium tuberculosis]|nr:putative peptidase, peptidase M23 family protein [Mycobacterium tuberculosis]